jgi:hypothetical protein
MAPNVNRFLAKSASKLGDICNRRGVQRPQRVFVKGFYALDRPYLDAVCEKIILPQ